MTILMLRYKKKNLKDFALMRGQHLTIGRNPDNDIVIDNPAVSGYHARVESVASNFVLRDLDSTNGVFVNKEKITTHALQHNDTIRIGKHELIFDKMVFDRSARVDQSQGEAQEFFRDETKFLDTKEHRELIEQMKQENKLKASEKKAQESKKKGILSGLKKKLLG